MLLHLETTVLHRPVVVQTPHGILNFLRPCKIRGGMGDMPEFQVRRTSQPLMLVDNTNVTSHFAPFYTCRAVSTLTKGCRLLTQWRIYILTTALYIKWKQRWRWNRIRRSRAATRINQSKSVTHSVSQSLNQSAWIQSERVDATVCCRTYANLFGRSSSLRQLL